jgi:hypothetical protein
MKSIPLTLGNVALVDDEDYEYLNQWKWRDSHGYAARSQWSPFRKSITMHALIMNTPPGMVTDHINGNKLDNRRENLRVCSRSENNKNRSKNSHSSSRYKGVCWIKRIKKWRAQIKHNNRTIHIGLYDKDDDAARAYDKSAKELFGIFARTNF